MASAAMLDGTGKATGGDVNTVDTATFFVHNYIHLLCVFIIILNVLGGYCDSDLIWS